MLLVVTKSVFSVNSPNFQKLESSAKEEGKLPNVEVPSFGTSPNDGVTAAGVALLSLAHQLSAHSRNTNMSASLANASKTETVGEN